MAGYKAFLSDSSKLHMNQLILDSQESHHLCRVLRATKECRVEVFDGKGMIYQTKLIDANSRNAELEVIEKKTYPLPETELVLLMSVPKPKAMDQILKHAVEIGIQRIIPVFSEHSAFVLNSEQMDAKLNKWQSILIESCKQSGCPILPHMNAIESLEQFCLKYESDWKENALGVVASLESDAGLMLDGLKHSFDRQKTIIYAVGPEGDFSKNEYKVFKDLGFLGVQLGEHVLRSETAVTYGLSVIDQFLRSR
jgi:16S rRNA (uracil1498-N3)-methyltransferase